ncbi:MAG: CCA tRNA nucleotidyltransferase [Rhodobacteraceae bacterium]|nr:CCA tRNA nucleotidyltransferase [Paracoccaceae bacterium]
MKVTGATWLAAAQPVFDMLERAGYRALAVGGCVRNELFGLPVKDVDIATDALPEAVMDLAQSAGLKAVPTGITHGTVTVVYRGEAYEITTFRKDITTDGRHAVVAFSTDIKEDAKRRDFTMNALYATADGTVIDPLGGLDDLLARRLCFIENAFARIEEDHLRSLRYFRFYALYCDPLNGPDMEAIAAISAHLDGLETLSAERVGGEMRKLLAAPDPAPALAIMAQTGVLARVLPGADPRFIAPLVMVESGQPIRWLRRLAALGGQDAAVRWRLSKAEQKALADIGKATAMPSLIEAGYRLGAEAAVDALLVQCASIGVPVEARVARDIEAAAGQIFPLKADRLVDRIPPGPALGAELKRLEALWISSGFTLGATALDKMVKG